MGGTLVGWEWDETLCDGVVAMYVLYTIRWTVATISIVKTLVANLGTNTPHVLHVARTSPAMSSGHTNAANMPRRVHGDASGPSSYVRNHGMVGARVTPRRVVIIQKEVNPLLRDNYFL